MAYLAAVYCTVCRTTMVGGSLGDTGCNCSTTMEHVLGLPEAERLEQDYSDGHMLPVPEIPDVVSLPEVSDAMVAECRAELEQAARRGWRTR